jgi:hypothetical protein
LLDLSPLLEGARAVSEPKSVAEMIGEGFREAAVLVTVFVPLDAVIASLFDARLEGYNATG